MIAILGQPRRHVVLASASSLRACEMSSHFVIVAAKKKSGSDVAATWRVSYVFLPVTAAM